MNDFLIFLVLAGVALVFRWLTNQAREESEKDSSPSPEEPASRPPTQSEEERVRKFLEALGVPPGTAPPRRMKPRSVRPRRVTTPQAQPPQKVRRSWVQPLPPLVTTPEEAAPAPAATAPEPTEPPARVETRTEVFISPAAEGPAESKVKVVRQKRPRSTVAPASASFMALLRTRNSVRQAIILREVLGPPRGLQPEARFDHA